jgi:hypothetical protein
MLARHLPSEPKRVAASLVSCRLSCNPLQQQLHNGTVTQWYSYMLQQSYKSVLVQQHHTAKIAAQYNNYYSICTCMYEEVALDTNTLSATARFLTHINDQRHHQINDLQRIVSVSQIQFKFQQAQPVHSGGMQAQFSTEW